MKLDFRRIFFAFADLAAAFVTWVVFFYSRKSILNESAVSPEEFPKIVGSALVISSFWAVVYYFLGFYHDIYHKSRIKELLQLLNASFWGSIFIFLTTLLDDIGVTNYKLYYSTLLLYFFLHFSLSSIAKILGISYLKSLIKRGKVSFNCLLVGDLEKVLLSKEELEKANHILGLKFIGFVSPNEREVEEKDYAVRYWGHTEDILKVIRRCYINRVVICINPTEHLTIKSITNLLAGSGTKVSVMPDLYQILIGSVKVEHVLGIPLINIDHDLMPFWQTVLKRWIDIAVAVFVMVLGLPFFVLIMCITKLTSKGPIFFVQERVGINGKHFRMIKFRSMFMDAESMGPALASDNDPRVTPWGKFMRKTRLDEFPQFWNVFIGDMSLVGPRPERQYFINQITKHAPEYRHLHKIRPGITSLGQVKYGYAENLDQMLQRLKYDLLYIENMSIANDFIILYFTILTVLRGKGK